jgi:hypothetical protein
LCNCGEYSINSENYNEYFYKTDEEMSDDEQYYKSNKRDDSRPESGSDKESTCSTRGSGSSRSSGSSGCSCCSSNSSVERSEFLLEGRLINGAETKLKLPTPLDILKHEYFSNYRKDTKLESLVKFEYKLT